MKNLNYCRQFMRDVSLGRCGEYPEVFDSIKLRATLIPKAQKFMLPSDLHKLDGTFKAIDESMPLRLPYPVVALEFYDSLDEEQITNQLDKLRERGADMRGYQRITKRILIADETIRKDQISIFGIGWAPSLGCWIPTVSVLLPVSGYIERIPGKDYVSMVMGFFRKYNGVGESQRKEYAAGDVEMFYGFLNALQCANVTIKTNQPTEKGGKQKKNAMPFDTYHVLSVGVKAIGTVGSSAGGVCDRNSPREHLRRGHVRKLQDGRSIWVNAAVVNPGVGGIIHKDYAV
jgi:hypothetical protein